MKYEVGQWFIYNDDIPFIITERLNKTDEFVYFNGRFITGENFHNIISVFLDDCKIITDKKEIKKLKAKYL